ncbi:MAG: ankyrin repeat domain-containing protein [Candidatus Micrarchaeota archaeon]|nr:ankyrin repeat domain-containing protein [Candidatus Micrarchaeota archaeon]
MVQKTGELTGLKAAEVIKAKKPKFEIPKTEGVQIRPEMQRRLNSRLIDAIEQGANEEIKRLVKRGAKIPGSEEERLETCLIDAIEQGDNKEIEILMNAHVDANSFDQFGRTALMLAITNLEKLEEYSKLCALLIKRGADVNANDDDGDTPLMLAVDEGNLGIIRMLIRSGANVNAKNNEGETALMRARDHRNKETINVITSYYMSRVLSNEEAEMFIYSFSECTSQ